jgi:hypothetical protein
MKAIKPTNQPTFNEWVKYIREQVKINNGIKNK